MARKSMRSFIRENKNKLVKAIMKIHPDLEKVCKSMSREEITVMIKNEKQLALWAKSQGVLVASKLSL